MEAFFAHIKLVLQLEGRVRTEARSFRGLDSRDGAGVNGPQKGDMKPIN